MMLGILVSSTIAGRAITRSGKIKPYVVAGTIILVAGFAGLSVLDHDTPLWYIGTAMAVVGAGVGMSMQNLVLVVQNTVALKDIGAASSTIAFFRSLGGTIGVSVLGAVLARRVSDSITEQLTTLGVPAGSSSSGTGSLDLAALPDQIQHVVRAAYGDATGHIFLISAGVAVIGVIAAIALKPTKLRSTVDLAPERQLVDVTAD
jgi:MFS family permease